MRLLGGRNVGRFPAAAGLERRPQVRREVHLHRGHGLRLSRLPLLRHHYFSGPPHSGLLRPHLSGRRQAGQLFLFFSRTPRELRLCTLFLGKVFLLYTRKYTYFFKKSCLLIWHELI